MSYVLFNHDGPVDHLASIQGMNDLIDFVKRAIPRGPLIDFLSSGETTDVAGVMKDIDQYYPFATSTDVRATMLNMKRCLNYAKGWAGISE